MKSKAATQAGPWRTFLPITPVQGVHPGDDGMAGACTTLANPWLELPTSPPYVLPEDAGAIEAFNRGADARHRVDATMLPEPFLGRPDVQHACRPARWKKTRRSPSSCRSTRPRR